MVSFAFSISQNEVTDIVSKQNNYLLGSEEAGVYKPAVTIAYQDQDYWVVAGIQNDTANVYIPINNETGELADGEIEKRKLIETEIVLSNIYQLKNSAYGTNWPFSYSMNSTFNDFQRIFSDMVPSVINIETELDALAGSNSLVLKTDNVQASFDDLAKDSGTIAELINEARIFEEEYFSQPDTNETDDYKDYFEDYFGLIEKYKSDYYELEAAVTELKNEIASFENASNEQKEFFLNILKMPRETSTLINLFPKIDQLKTLIEGVFNKGENIEAYIGNLETRKSRNAAWQVIYGTSTKITEAGKSYNIKTLDEAASLILNSEYVDYWTEQDSVSALRTNFGQAEGRYERGDYDKAKNFADKAEANAQDILEGDYVIPENEIPQELIIQIVIVLIVILAAVFIFEKVIKKKKPEEETGYQGYEEYENQEQ